MGWGSQGGIRVESWGDVEGKADVVYLRGSKGGLRVRCWGLGDQGDEKCGCDSRVCNAAGLESRKQQERVWAWNRKVRGKGGAGRLKEVVKIAR